MQRKLKGWSGGGVAKGPDLQAPQALILNVHIISKTLILPGIVPSLRVIQLKAGKDFICHFTDGQGREGCLLREI